MVGIKLENIDLTFGEKVIFSGFSHEFPSRGVTCIMGSSGRGKTTLLRLLLGLQKPDSGKVISVQRPAVVFQEDCLLPWLTAGENIAAVSSRSPERFLAMVGLEDEKNTLPAALSGGMARRVALARALAYDGDALFLDEPFKGLDEDIKSVVMNLIYEYSANRPVILVTHDEADARNLDGEILLLR